MNMKKYVKPELFYEHFELSTHIANCKFEPFDQEEPTNCQFIGDVDSEWAGVIAFANDCAMKIDCYYPGVDGVNTFDS